MKIWTYKEMEDKILRDLDLEDETFINRNEMIGYFNESLNEAESEIITLHQDYFLTEAYLPVVVGQSTYPLPYNIYARKIRGVLYQNGSVNYEIAQYRRKFKFLNMALTEEFGQADDYRYTVVSNNIAEVHFVLLPKSRETATLSPQGSVFAPMRMWYIRNCARVPLLGEFCNPELVANTQVDPSADSIQTYSGTSTIGIVQKGVPGAYPGSVAYKTGDKVRLMPGPNGVLPAPLVPGATYYAIAIGGGVIRLATTLALALSGNAIDLTDTGTVYFTIEVSATNQVIDATLIDIPEFSTFVMQWVKCRCLEKEGDPRIDGASALLIQQKKQMVDTLTQAIEDDDDTIEADFSSYQEMS